MGKVPILVLAFNRADHVSEVMKLIREYRPEKLYLECDGPRKNKPGEDERVTATQRCMLEFVDWPCELKTLFRSKNLGCAHAVYDAITWFFKEEEYGIILEDDIIVSLDFFKLCEELLPRYSANENIMEIVSQNHSYRTLSSNTYVYSWREDCWGWATWARAWKKMDMSMSAVPSLSLSFMIKKLGYFQGLVEMYYYKQAYRHLQHYSSWAFRWRLSILINEGLVIVPGVNLSKNIGMDAGVHYEYGDEDPYKNLNIGKMIWPIVYNDSFTIDKNQEKADKKDFFNVRVIGLKKKIFKIFK